MCCFVFFFFFSSRRRHTRCSRDWSSDVCSSDLFAGSTAAMADYVGQKRPARVVLLTECSMSDNVALQYPDLDFVRPCNLCPHMKRITLRNIRHALETMTHEVTIAPEVADRARQAV